MLRKNTLRKTYTAYIFLSSSTIRILTSASCPRLLHTQTDAIISPLFPLDSALSARLLDPYSPRISTPLSARFPIAPDPNRNFRRSVSGCIPRSRSRAPGYGFACPQEQGYSGRARVLRAAGPREGTGKRRVQSIGYRLKTDD
jgi:hypothetical protein